MLEGVLAFRKPTSPPKKLVLEDTVMMGGFNHIIVILKYPPHNYYGIGIIQLVLLVFLSLVLFLYMIKVVWVLVPHTLPTPKLIVLLMVVILCHLGVVIFYQ